MAMGNKVQFGPISVNVGDSLNLQPGVGAECVIHNIVFEDSMELYITDGSNSIKSNSRTGNDSFMGMFLHCTNAKYWSIKNVSTGAQLIYADGVQTK
jgi:hypothetical protein